VTASALKKLLAAAQAARRHAYAPYSKFRVGAALLTVDGKTFTGCNVENASYGLTICAERIAVTNAVSTGYRKFQAIAIVAPCALPTPCGACRQVLAEFSDMLVVCADSRRLATGQIYQLAELLPAAFHL